MQTAGQHDSESHIHDKSTRGLSIVQGAALEQVVRSYPLASATEARRSLNLQGPSVSISPSKQRSVRTATAKVREHVLSQFTQGERVSNDEGSMTSMCVRIYIKPLVEEHNRGGEHMNLHAPICLGFQFFKNVKF